MQPAQAQYKVIGADGKVTYTDRAPSDADAKITALGARGAAAATEAELPYELRQVASRYPVTLYVISGACEPCELARALLRQRGIPYAEKTVASTDDSDALEKLSGGRDTPTVTIGAQVVRGLTADLWNSYLDAAGYPRESKLPASYQARAATPVVERRETAAAPRPAARPAPGERPLERAPVTSGGIQF
ncbi:MAG: glutaredoxin family protein [Rhizobacter sp.]